MKEGKIIPENESGVETNTESSRNFNTIDEAKNFYQKVKHRLLDINNWKEAAGIGSASFQLTDSGGNEVDRSVQKDDHFKIDIPGPGPVTGQGYDWVKVETIEEDCEGDKEFIAIKVRPATNPGNERKDIAHFFSDEATSCFMVKRESTKVTAAVYGRNEKPNTDSETIIDKARNAAIATGAITGFSKIQWKSLVNGLIKE